MRELNSRKDGCNLRDSSNCGESREETTAVRIQGSYEFYTHPVPQIRTTDKRIRILLFSSVTFTKPTKKNFFPMFFAYSVGIFILFLKDKKF
jgi:hypothetical protein